VATRADNIAIIRSINVVGPGGARADITTQHIWKLRRDWLPGGAQRRIVQCRRLRTYVRSFPETVVCKMVLLL
jgi:hypothetical protein